MWNLDWKLNISMKYNVIFYAAELMDSGLYLLYIS